MTRAQRRNCEPRLAPGFIVDGMAGEGFDTVNAPVLLALACPAGGDRVAEFADLLLEHRYGFGIALAALDAGVETHLPVVEERQFDTLLCHDALDGDRAVGDHRVERLHVFVGQRFDHLCGVAAHQGDVGAAVAASADAETFHTDGVAHQCVGRGEQFVDRQRFAAGIAGVVAGRYGECGQQEDEEVFHFYKIGFRPGGDGSRRSSPPERRFKIQR